MNKIFIDGKAGTTGLRIYDRLKSRDDIELITLSDEMRKDKESRKKALNSCDIAFLCLPDDASREAVSLIENENVTVIDTSTAHRTLSDWAYGFPELSEKFEQKIINSNRIAVPGCHASGFISLVYPLVESGILKTDSLLDCFSVTGYSGGGKKMIEEYESEDKDFLYNAPRQYGLTQNHKHLKEMTAICRLEASPIFCPVVSDFYSGMVVTVPIFKKDLGDYNIDDIKNIYKQKYNGKIVFYNEFSEPMLSANQLSQKDSMMISVLGNSDRIILCATYDNLGKGASGAAIECMNIKLGTDRTRGLDL